MAEQDSVHNLLCRLKHGSDESIDILYPYYRRVFYAYARRLRLTHEEAEDAVGEMFWRILNCIGSYDEIEGGGERWMWRICRNVTVDILRKRRSREKLVDFHLVYEDIGPEEYFEKNEIAQAFACAWGRISQADQEELRRGRGRGIGRKKWHEAFQRLRAFFRVYYEGPASEE